MRQEKKGEVRRKGRTKEKRRNKIKQDSQSYIVLCTIQCNTVQHNVFVNTFFRCSESECDEYSARSLCNRHYRNFLQ